MSQHNTEERLSIVESKVAHLELAREAQETRDLALLARIDSFIGDLHRVERTQIRGFDARALQIKGTKDDIRQLQKTVTVLVTAVEKQERNIEILAGTARDHKAAIENIDGRVLGLTRQVQELTGHIQELAVGQRLIIELLTGKRPEAND